jgi:NADH-quinone oxidoreductase subunit C
MSEAIRDSILQAVPGAKAEIVASTPAAQQPAIVVDREHAFAAAKFLKEDSRYQMDYCSCVTGVDYLKAGFIEVVYHLYSTTLKTGPVVLKVRAPRDLEQCRVPSLTPLWRGCEFQEREAYDLYGVKFTGHPDLRRILMWDEFTDFPMRKDYVPPMDYEWEPTPHDDTLQRSVENAGIIPPSAREELAKAAKK